jgi:hypothetical protein
MTNPYFNNVTPLRRPATKDFQYNPNISMPKNLGFPQQQAPEEPQGQGFDYMGLANGVMGLAGNYSNMANHSLGLNAQIAPVRTDSFSAPTYTAGQAYSQASNARPQGATGQEIMSGIGQGASAGAAFGPIGAGIGAVVGGVTSIFGGSRRKRKQKREKERALARASAAQKEFNTADVSFRQQQNQKEDYLERTNNDARLYNLYRNQI